MTYAYISSGELQSETVEHGLVGVGVCLDDPDIFCVIRHCNEDSDRFESMHGFLEA